MLDWVLLEPTKLHENHETANYDSTFVNKLINKSWKQIKSTVQKQTCKKFIADYWKWSILQVYNF